MESELHHRNTSNASQPPGLHQSTSSKGSSSTSSSSSSSSSSSTSLNTLEEQTERGEWGGALEFVLTLIGFAVGLGNVWRFPYLAYQNGGGAFLIPYFIVLLFIGLPMYYMELSFGQFSSRGPLSVWSINPMFKGLGISMTIIAAYIVCYYNVIVTWCMYYFFASMTKELPWKYCNNWWNTEACIDDSMNITQIVINGTIHGLRPTTPSEEYYYNNVLRLSPGLEYSGTIVWQLACMLFLAWLVIFFVLIKGIQSVGKAAYFVTLFPYLLLTVLLAQAATLDGALDGVKFYMTPQWDRLKDAEVWGSAATQIFYSTGICMGSLIAMSSFNKFNNNLQRDSILIPIVNCMTSVYSGFVVFTMLGHIAKSKNLPIDAVAQTGPGLIFVVYPEGLALLPVAPLWAVLFFFMLVTLGFSSQFSMAEGVCASIADEYPILRKGKNPVLFRLGYCVLNFFLALPMVTEGGFYVFNIVNDYCASYTVMITALMEIAAVAWIYGFRRFMDDIEMMLGHKPSYFFVACWVGIAPALILAVMIFTALQQSPMMFGEYAYPAWGNALAWMIVAFPLTMSVGWMLGVFMSQGGAAVCVRINQPTEEWGPVLSTNRTGRYAKRRPEEELIDHPPFDQVTSDTHTSDTVFSVEKDFTPPPYNGHSGNPNVTSSSYSYDNKAYHSDDTGLGTNQSHPYSYDNKAYGDDTGFSTNQSGNQSDKSHHHSYDNKAYPGDDVEFSHTSLNNDRSTQL